MNKRLVNKFIEMVKISSESGNEGEFHNYLIRELEMLGLSVIEDNSMKETKLGGNNIIASLKGNTSGSPIFFSCHTDTVKPGNDIEVLLKDNIIYSKGNTILGADDKAGIAVLLEMIQIIQESNLSHPDIELIFSPGEEIGLVGAKALDLSTIKAQHGLVLDNAGEVGSITLGSPTLAVIECEVYGKSSHAGIEPEKGISSICVLGEIIAKLPTGRINDLTTCNVGYVQGGNLNATNVVSNYGQLQMEVRAVNQQDYDRVIEAIKDIIRITCDEFGATYTLDVDIKCVGYLFDKNNDSVSKVVEALKRIDIEPRYEISGGGSDANVFNAQNLIALNMSIGYEAIHTVDESISIEALEDTLRMCLSYVEVSNEE